MSDYADVSHYQTMNLDAYWAKHDRLAMKVTEGTGYVDPTFGDRYADAVRRGRPTKLYHFDRARFAGEDQFDFYVSQIRRVRPAGPRPFPLDLLCLDSEDTDTPSQAAASAHAFSYRGAAQGYPGSQYTGVWYANPYGLTASVLHPTWRRQWLSDYGATSDLNVRQPNGWTRAQLIGRQWTDRATIPGITGTADYSRVINDWLTVTPQEDGMTQEDQDAINAHTDAAHAELWRKLTAMFGPSGITDGNAWPNNGFGVRFTANTRALLAPIQQSITGLTQDAAADADKILIAIADVVLDPGVPNDDPDAVVEALRDALVRGTAAGPTPTT